MKIYIQPYADIFAWCLMPNHFHLMVYVNDIELPIKKMIDKNGKEFVGVDKSAGPSSSSEALAQSESLAGAGRTFNNSIGIMLRSYTNAVQKQENRVGSLFQRKTKAVCLTDIKGLSPSYFNTAFGTVFNLNLPEKDYPQVCFNYIHQNPVAAGLVKVADDWEYSSYLDYAGLRSGTLVNKQSAQAYINFG